MKIIRLHLTALLALLFTASSWAQTPPVASAAKKPNWDEKFDGVVHDAKKIGGFVGEYRWLSNFFMCPVTWEGRSYTSSEAAYQSGKYPPAERDVFMTLDPDPAKKLSRTKPYDTAVWEARKERTMREVVTAKFTQNRELAEKLIATGDRVLEETNWWGDKIWGTYQGVGENKLGILLMDVRAQLLKERAAGKKAK